MNFRVDTAQLRTAMNRLKDLGSDTSIASTYAIDHLDVSGDENGMLFVHVDDVCTDVRLRVLDVLNRLDSLLHDSGAELGAVATWYDRTDQDSLQRLDAQIPPDTPLTPEDKYDGSGFEDTVPEDPGDWTPPEELDDDEIILAPGPFDTYNGGYADSPSGVQA